MVDLDDSRLCINISLFVIFYFSIDMNVEVDLDDSAIEDNDIYFCGRCSVFALL